MLIDASNNYELQLYFGQARNVSELYTPAGGVENLWSDSFEVDSLGWSLPMVTAKPNVAVKEVSYSYLQAMTHVHILKGEYYAIYASSTGGTVPYCYMYRQTNATTSSMPGQSGTFMAEIQQGRYPLFPVDDMEISFYVQIE